jgi:WD40 repeat protein
MYVFIYVNVTNIYLNNVYIGTWNARIKGKWVFHTSKITCLCWSPSGQFLVSGSQDESLILWSCEMPSKKFQVIIYVHIYIV